MNDSSRLEGRVQVEMAATMQPSSWRKRWPHTYQYHLISGRLYAAWADEHGVRARNGTGSLRVSTLELRPSSIKVSYGTQGFDI